MEIGDGNILGAVKFEKYLPWELDGDGNYDPKALEKVHALESELTRPGYSFHVDKVSEEIPESLYECVHVVYSQ